MGEFLLKSRNAVEVYAADDGLHSVLDSVVRKHLVRMVEKPPPHRFPGGLLPPDSGSNSSGGLPAEVRVWEVARGETPDDPDPEREERPPGLPPAPPEPDDGLDVD